MRRAKILLVFGTAAVIFLGPTILGKKILSQADVLYFFPPWSACRPADLLQASNPLLGDQSLQFYPYREFAQRQVSEGVVPLWNPFILTGTPFLANMQSAVFSPFSVFSYVGNLKRSFAWSALCRLLVAGIGMYYLCRLLAVSELGAVLAGLSFMFSAFQVVWLNHPHTNVSVLLPWAFVAIEKSVSQPDRRSLLLMAAVVAALLLGGHPETVLHIALGTVVFFLYRLGQQWREEHRLDKTGARLVSAVGGALLGLGLAAVAVAPFVELLWHSHIWEARGNYARNPFVLEFSTLLTTIAPDLFGNPASGSDYGPSNYNERNAYAGLFSLLLALLSVRHVRQDSRVRFFLGWGLFCLTIIHGVWPIFDLLTWLPLFHHAANHRLLFFWQFCIAVLAGIAADHILRAKQGAKAAVPDRFWILAGGLILLPFCLWLVPQLGFVKQNSHTFRGAFLPIVIGAAGLSLFTLLRKERMTAHPWGIAACVLVFLDLFLFGHNYNPAVKKNRVFHCLPGSVRFLFEQDGIFRIAALEGGVLLPNTSMVYGLQDLRGYELPAPERMPKFFTEGLQGHYDGAHYELKVLSAQTLRLLSLTNVRYVLSTQELTDPHLTLSKVYSGEVQVYENPNVFPRAFVVHQVQVAADSHNALTKIIDSSINLREVGILEAGDSLANHQHALVNPEKSSLTEPCSDNAEITQYDPQRVHLQVYSCGPGVVVLTDTHYVGWKVYVDGIERPLGRADYLFRGVYVDGGRHEVQFVYDPLSYKIGLALTIVSLLFFLFVLLSSRVGARRYRQTAN